MDDRSRRLVDVLTLGVIWTVLWPVIGLSVVGVLAIVLGANGDVGPIEIIAILAPLGLIGGIVFGGVTVLVARRPTEPTLMVAALIGTTAAVAAGLIAGIQPTAVVNAMVLGAIAGPSSVLITKRLHQRSVVAV